jgi:hypothetical protein
MICDGCEREVFRAKQEQESKKWFCKDCYPVSRGVANVPGAVFPFTTTNISGQPIQVQSLRHLRKLEATYGVSSVAFNTDSHNFDCPPRGR